jgi:hypothetical protein
VLVLLDESGPRTLEAIPAGSVHDEGPSGLSVARRFLEAEQKREGTRAGVGVFSGRIGIDPLPDAGVLFRIQPIHGPLVPRQEEIVEEDQDPDDEEKEPEPSESREQRRARQRRQAEAERAKSDERRMRSPLLTMDEEAWVGSGGRLVLGLGGVYGPMDVAPSGGPVHARKVFPDWPGVSRLEPGEEGRGLVGRPLAAARTLFVRGDRPLVAVLPLGKGEVVLLGAPGMLSNGALGKADHAALLAVLAGKGRPVLFDERAHGFGADASLLALLLEFGLGPSLLVSALGLGLALWRGRVRVGEPEAESEDRRSEAVDLVDSLGALYERALSRSDALRLYAEGLRRAVASRTGLRGPALDKRMEVLTRGVTSAPSTDGEMTPGAFAEALAAVNDGYRRLEEHAHPR